MKTALFWLRWSWRDLHDRWLLVVAIAATIAIGTGAYAALDSLTAWRTNANAESLAMLQAHDVRLTLADGSFARAGSLSALARGIPHANLVASDAERVVVPTRVETSTGAQTIVVRGRLIGMPAGPSAVDRLQVRGGRGLEATDAGKPVAVLEDHFARHYDLPMPTSITLADGSHVQVVGRAMSSEYLIVVAPDGGVLAEADFAVVFMPADSAAAVAGHPGSVNQMVLRLTDPSKADLVRDELQSVATQRIADLGPTTIAAPEEEARRWVVNDASGDGTFFGVFAMILLGGAALAAFNLTSRIVEAQRRQIGIGLALGVSPRTLAIRPLAVSGEIALMGVALGVVFGLAFGALLGDVFSSMLPMPVFKADLQLDVFARAAAFGFAIPFAASLYPVWRAVRARPIEAIRTGFLTARRPGLVRLAAGLHIPGGSLVQLPVRNVLRTPRRTLLTALGITAAITVLVGTLGMLDTLNSGIDGLQRDLLSAPNRLEIVLQGPGPETSLRSQVAAVPGAGRVDPGLIFPATASVAGKKIDLTLQIQSLTDNVWRPRVSAGRLPSAADEILLSDRAAADLALNLGDVLILQHPQRVGETAVTTVDSKITLVGTMTSPSRPGSYMAETAAAAFGFAGLANRASLVPAAGTTLDELRRPIFELPGVVSVQPVDSLVTAMRSMIDQIAGVLSVAALMTLLLALLVAYNSASIAQDERSREVATMLAFGLPVRRVMGMAVLESGLTGLVGTALGLVGGFAMLYWLTYSLLPQSMPDFALQPAIGASTGLLAAALGIFAVALAPLITIRRLLRMDLPATLRVVE